MATSVIPAPCSTINDGKKSWVSLAWLIDAEATDILLSFENPKLVEYSPLLS